MICLVSLNTLEDINSTKNLERSSSLSDIPFYTAYLSLIYFKYLLYILIHLKPISYETVPCLLLFRWLFLLTTQTMVRELNTWMADSITNLPLRRLLFDTVSFIGIIFYVFHLTRLTYLVYIHCYFRLNTSCMVVISTMLLIFMSNDRREYILNFIVGDT